MPPDQRGADGSDRIVGIGGVCRDDAVLRRRNSIDLRHDAVYGRDQAVGIVRLVPTAQELGAVLLGQLSRHAELSAGVGVIVYGLAAVGVLFPARADSHCRAISHIVPLARAVIGDVAGGG